VLPRRRTPSRVYFPELTYVASPKLIGFEANPYGTYPFEQFSLSK
jgi:hypothetical protein